MNFEKYLLVSDVDGTLINSNFEVPLRNKEAIARFVANGGGFAIASGRSSESIRHFSCEAHVNRPCVVLNGPLVFDMQKNIPVYEDNLPEEAAEYTRRFMEKFPTAGIEIFTGRHIYIPRANRHVLEHMQREGLSYMEVPLEQIKEPWCKMLVAADAETQKEIHAFTDTLQHEGVRFVATSDIYWEMMPLHADKGTGIAHLAKTCGYQIENVIAIGDYYNDVEMLQAAGISASPANAPEDIRNMTDLVTGRCEDGAVADVIEWLEQKG